MARLLKHTWFPIYLLALSAVYAARFNEPFAWFVLGFNAGVALTSVLFVLSRYGRMRFPS